MPDRTVTSLHRAVAAAAVAGIAAIGVACSSSRATDTSWKAENAYGSRMAKQGFWREALFRYEKAAAEKPGDAEIQNNLAVAYESIGDTSHALAAYKRALQLAPQDAKIKRNYARFAEYYTSVQRAASLPAPSSARTQAPKPETPGVSIPKPSGAPPAGPGPETVPPPSLPSSPAPPAGAPAPAPAPVAPTPAPTPPSGAAT